MCWHSVQIARYALQSEVTCWKAMGPAPGNKWRSMATFASQPPKFVPKTTCCSISQHLMANLQDPLRSFTGQACVHDTLTSQFGMDPLQHWAYALQVLTSGIMHLRQPYQTHSMTESISVKIWCNMSLPTTPMFLGAA